MRIEYGYVRAKFNGMELSFIPSLSNISRIGTPTEIIDAFNDVFAIDAREWFSKSKLISTQTAKLVKRHAGQKALKTSILVLSCCSEEDPTPLVGGYKSARGKAIYQPGFGEIEHIIGLAQAMMIHGVMGRPKTERAKKETTKISEFDAASYAEMARIHLSISRDEAWELTMTEWIRLFEAKFPPQEEEKDTNQLRMGREEYDKKMAQAKKIVDAINKKREVRNG